MAIQHTVNDMVIPGTDTEVFEINGHSCSLLVYPERHVVEVVAAEGRKAGGKPAKAGKAGAVTTASCKVSAAVGWHRRAAA